MLLVASLQRQARNLTADELASADSWLGMQYYFSPALQSLTIAQMVSGEIILNSDPRTDFWGRWGLIEINDRDRVDSWMWLLLENWSYRYFQVETGVETSRYDQSFRLALKKFLQLRARLSPDDQKNLDDATKFYGTGLSYCQDDAGNYVDCTAYDLFIAHPEHIAHMTSNPADSRPQRFGF